MKATELPVVLGGLPAPWRAVLPQWTPQAQARVAQAVGRVSGNHDIAPADPFRALRLVSPQQVKVVILGQDPYPGDGHADGLAFSAARGRPASLRRVFDVLEADRPGWRRPSGCRLDAWAHQGVLLLNTALTVEVGAAGSHLGCGWQELTTAIVRWLARREPPPVFLLWGTLAQAFFDAACPAPAAARVLRTRHPSYDFQRQFMAGASHFQATADLVDWWCLTDTPAGHAILAGSPEGCPSG